MKKNFWYYVKEGAKLLAYSAISFAPEILGQFEDYTAAAKLAMPLGLIFQGLGVKKKYMKNVLPDFATRLLDKVPNKITGEKGSLPSGLSEKMNK